MPHRIRRRARRSGFGSGPLAQNGGMRLSDLDLKRPLVLLALAGSLVACGGDNTNFDRGSEECSSSEDSGDCAENEDDQNDGEDEQGDD